MSQPILIKVYGNLTPVDKQIFQRLCALCRDACPVPQFAPCELNGDLLTVAFEGISFPVQEMVAGIEAVLKVNMIGKLDLLDLENWQLTRYAFKNGLVHVSSAPLNNVLDYSGH